MALKTILATTTLILSSAFAYQAAAQVGPRSSAEIVGAIPTEGPARIRWACANQPLILAVGRLVSCTRVIRSPADNAEIGWAYANRAAANASVGNWSAALADAAKARDLAPNEPLGWSVEGFVLARKGQLDKAFTLFDQALKRGPDLETFIWRGNIYQSRKQLDQAFADYDAAVRLRPDHFAGRAARAVLYLDRKEYQRAIDDLDVAIVGNPNAAYLFHNRGVAYFRAARNAEAKADFGRAVLLEPRDADSFSARAMVWNDEGDLQNARVDAAKAVKLRPDDPELLASLASLQMELGEREIGLKNFDRALKRGTADVFVLMQRCWIRAALNESLELAGADCERALTLDPNDGDTLGTRGLLRMRQGNLTGAVSDLTAAFEKNPEDYASLYLRGVIGMRSATKADAKVDVQNALRGDPYLAARYKRLGIE